MNLQGRCHEHSVQLAGDTPGEMFASLLPNRVMYIAMRVQNRGGPLFRISLYLDDPILTQVRVMAKSTALRLQ